MYQLLLDILPSGEAILTVDYAENFKMNLRVHKLHKMLQNDFAVLCADCSDVLV